MEPRNYEKPSESGNDKENLALPPKERKRRFQIVRLEERVAPRTTRWTQGCTEACYPHL
jgi:hypothetical protein